MEYQTLTENAADDIVSKLTASAEGQTCLAKVNDFLQVYGLRSDTLQLGSPCWIEDPTPVTNNLQDDITLSERDISAETDNIATRWEQWVTEARVLLLGYPLSVVAQVEAILKAAQVGNTFRDEVFYLTLAQLKETSVAPPFSSCRTLVNERRATETDFATIKPPVALGTVPSSPSPDDPSGRATDKVFGDLLPPSETANDLRGHAGSPGVVQRTANRGAPVGGGATTRTRRYVGAVVTDSGRTLSPCTVLAREYGIPPL